MSTEIRIPVADEWHGASWTWDTRHRPLAFVDVAAAVAEEREACAKIAETMRGWGGDTHYSSIWIAEAIRARGHR